MEPLPRGGFGCLRAMSGGEAFDGPGIFPLPGITKAVVQPVGTALPKLDAGGAQNISAPKRRFGHLATAVLFLILVPLLFQFRTVSHHGALMGSPPSHAAPTRRAADISPPL